jgi:putative nucleotidyltransferase with HDIG domain
MESKQLDHAVMLASALHQYDVWVVGGYVRDMLVGAMPGDIDLATTATPEQVQSMLRYTSVVPTSVVPVGIEFGTLKVLLLGPGAKPYAEFEITTLRKDLLCDGRHAKVEFTTDLAEDLARRDFTINAMAYNLKTKELIDPFNGQEDLKNRTIRAVGDPATRFKEDHLRMIRACRFAGYGKGFAIEPKTWAAILEHRKLIQGVSKERIRDEILKMMKTPKPSKCINALRNTGLLHQIVPLVAIGIGVEQNKHHAEEVYDHCVATCDHLSPDNPILRLVGLLHDVGKPSTMEGEGEEAHFYNHEIVGAEAVYDWMREYKFPREDCEYASLLVRHHMYHFTYETKLSTIKKWMGKLKGHHWDLMDLREADRAGNKAKEGKPLVTAHQEYLMSRMREIEKYKPPMSVKDLDIGGHDLIEMGFSPGPIFGAILDDLLDEVLEDPNLNEKEILRGMVEERNKGGRYNSNR